MNSILIIAADFPYPENHGGRVDVMNKIKELYSFGFSIDFLCTTKQPPTDLDVKELSKYINSFQLLFRKKSILDIFSIKPHQIKSRNKLAKYINKEHFRDNYDYILVEGHYVLELSNYFVPTKKLFLRIHNSESKYFCQLGKSTNNIIKKIYYCIESLKFFIYERNAFKNREIELLHISKDELITYQKKFPEIPQHYLPPFCKINAITNPFSRKNYNVLFVGSLFMPNNIQGLKWFIRHIHPKLIGEFKEYNLIIAGKLYAKNSVPFFKDKNIIFYDSPDDLTHIYREASVFINPMLSGAGVKLKTINAILHGVPIVSTSVGSEGIGLTHKKDVYITDKPTIFFEYIKLLLTRPEIGFSIASSAQSYLNTNFNYHKYFCSIFGE